MMTLPFIDQRCSSSRWDQAWVKEEPFICELENVPHHGGGEGQGCGGRSLWCRGIGVGGEGRVGEEAFRGSGKREFRCIF